MKNYERWIKEKEKTRAVTGSTTTREKGFLKNSLGDKRSKETILTHIEIGRQNYVRGILNL